MTATERDEAGFDFDLTMIIYIACACACDVPNVAMKVLVVQLQVAEAFVLRMSRDIFSIPA